MRPSTLLPGALGLLASCCPPPQPYVGPNDKPGNGPDDVVPNLPPVQACADAPLVTLEELARGVHAGDRVTVVGIPQPWIACEAKLCWRQGEDDCTRRPVRCCNPCGGEYTLELGDELKVALRGAGRCSGMDCGYRCEPFGIRPAHKYRFVGVNDFHSKGETSVWAKSDFAVEKVCLAE